MVKLFSSLLVIHNKKTTHNERACETFFVKVSQARVGLSPVVDIPIFKC